MHGVHPDTSRHVPSSSLPFPIRAHHQIFFPRDLLCKISRPRLGKRPLRPHPRSHLQPQLTWRAFYNLPPPALLPAGKCIFGKKITAWIRSGLAAILEDRPFAFYLIDGIQNISLS